MGSCEILNFDTISSRFARVALVLVVGQLEDECPNGIEGGENSGTVHEICIASYVCLVSWDGFFRWLLDGIQENVDEMFDGPEQNFKARGVSLARTPTRDAESENKEAADRLWFSSSVPTVLIKE
jgi:hypothetical protein